VPLSFVSFLIVVAALLLLPRVSRIVMALAAGGAIGHQALARQPDRIELREAGLQAWKDPAAAQRLSEPLLVLGYELAGTFTVPELSGVVVRLLVHSRECVLAAVYEHPRAGYWIDVATRYVGGTSFTVSSCLDRGLATRPGHPIVHLPGAEPAALHERLLASRPKAGMERPDSRGAARTFEQAFAAGMAWRKSQGISTAEVVTVAVRPVRKQRAA
jgi:hypothetical protein